MTCRLFLFASVLLFSTCANAERHDDSTGEFLSDIPASAASNHRGDDMLLSLLAESSNGAEESKDAATAADDVAVFDSCEDDDVRLEASTQRAFKTCAEVPVEMCTDKTYTKVARKYCPKRHAHPHRSFGHDELKLRDMAGAIHAEKLLTTARHLYLRPHHCVLTMAPESRPYPEVR
jgi:hypothetical protein